MLTKAILFALVLAIFCSRPSLPGDFIAPVSAVAVVSLTMLFVLMNREKTFQFRGAAALVLLTSVAFWAYYVSICGIKGFRFDAALKGGALHILSVVPLLLIMSTPTVGRTLLRYMLMLLAGFGFSSAITIGLLQFVPASSLEIMSIDNRREDNEQVNKIMLPLSVLYHEYEAVTDKVALAEGERFTIMRFSCFLRESGICQAFASWGIVCCTFFRIRSWLTLVGLIFAFLASISTASLISAAFIGMAFIFQWNISLISKLAWCVVAGATGIAIVLFAPVIGYMEKSQSSGSSSITERLSAIIQAWSAGTEYMFGASGSLLLSETAGICLLGEVLVFGIVGFILVVAIYLLPLLSLPSSRFNALLAISPLLVTSLTSQPMGYAPLTIVAVALTFCVAEEPVLEESIDESEDSYSLDPEEVGVLA